MSAIPFLYPLGIPSRQDVSGMAGTENIVLPTTNLMPIEDYVSELTNWDKKDNKEEEGNLKILTHSHMPFFAHSIG